MPRRHAITGGCHRLPERCRVSLRLKDGSLASILGCRGAYGGATCRHQRGVQEAAATVLNLPDLVRIQEIFGRTA